MHASAFNRYLVIRTAENRIEFADINSNTGLVVLIVLGVILIVRVIRIIVHAVQIKLLRLPRLAIFWKSIGIGGDLECFLRDDAGNLMMAVSVARRAGKSGDDDFRTEVTDDPNVIAEDLIVIPLRERVFGRFRKTEFVVRREKLLRAIEAARRHQFFCTNDSKRFK